MEKIAFVVQRYGLEVNGGSEYYTRMLAERLKQTYDVHVITTCALDYVTWDNHYQSGTESINGITVHRFPVDFTRNIKEFDALDEIHTKKHTNTAEENWIKAQGPVSSPLVDYIKNHEQEYVWFIMMTYLYYPTFKTMPLVAHKAVFIPTAHDEAAIYLRIFSENFQIPKRIAYLTPEEQEFVVNMFHNDHVVSDVIGTGLEIENKKLEDCPPPINGRYLLYVGRIDESKGCGELINFFIQYINRSQSNIPLYLIGQQVMNTPSHPLIRPLGFVDEDIKIQYMKNAQLLIMPSYYESLSLVTLESMYLRVPVLVNGHSSVLKGHCIRSNGGLYYRNQNEFIFALDLLLRSHSLCQQLAANAQNYIFNNYTWKSTISRLNKLMER